MDFLEPRFLLDEVAVIFLPSDPWFLLEEAQS